MLHQGGEQRPGHQQARQQHRQRRLPASAAPFPQPAPQSQPGPPARCADPQAPAAPAADHPAREAPVGLHRPAAAAWTRHRPVGSVGSDQLQPGPCRPLAGRTVGQQFEILKREAGTHRAGHQAPVPPAAGCLPSAGRDHPYRCIALGIPLRFAPDRVTPAGPALRKPVVRGSAASGIVIAGIPLRMTAGDRQRSETEDPRCAPLRRQTPQIQWGTGAVVPDLVGAPHPVPAAQLSPAQQVRDQGSPARCWPSPWRCTAVSERCNSRYQPPSGWGRSPRRVISSCGPAAAGGGAALRWWGSRMAATRR